jgi:CRP/FNR family transcriptional regulator
MLKGNEFLTDNWSGNNPIAASGVDDAAARPLNDAGIARMFSTRPAHYSAKGLIYHEGAKVDTIYVIRRGMVKLVSHLPNGRARIVRVHSTGSWLGLGGLLGRPYEHTAIAVDDVEVYRIPASELMRVKSEDPRLYSRLIEHWFDYLQEADLWIAELSTGAIKARVARLVNFLSRIENMSASREVKLLTCEEMAEILGATPESVSRVLAEFKRENVLSPCPTSQSGSHACYERNESALNDIAQH